MRAAVAFCGAVLLSSQVFAQHCFREIDIVSGVQAGQGAAALRVATGAGIGADGSVWVCGKQKLEKYAPGGGQPLVEIPNLLETSVCDADDSGNVYVGTWSGNVVFPSRVSKLDPSGNPIWTASMFGGHSLRVKVTGGGLCVVAWGTRLTAISSSGSPMWTVETLGSPETLCIDRQSGSVGAGRQLVAGGTIIGTLPQNRAIVAVGGGVAWVGSTVGPGRLDRHNAATGSYANTPFSTFYSVSDGVGFADGSCVLVERGGLVLRRITAAAGQPWEAHYGRKNAGYVPTLGVASNGSRAVLFGDLAED